MHSRSTARPRSMSTARWRRSTRCGNGLRHQPGGPRRRGRRPRVLHEPADARGSRGPVAPQWPAVRPRAPRRGRCRQAGRGRRPFALVASTQLTRDGNLFVYRQAVGARGQQGRRRRRLEWPRTRGVPPAPSEQNPLPQHQARCRARQHPRLGAAARRTPAERAGRARYDGRGRRARTRKWTRSRFSTRRWRLFGTTFPAGGRRVPAGSSGGSSAEAAARSTRRANALLECDQGRPAGPPLHHASRGMVPRSCADFAHVWS